MTWPRDMREVVRGHIEDVAGRGLWQDQSVPGRARHDVEEGEGLVVLVDLVRGEFAAQDLGEDVVRVVSGHKAPDQSCSTKSLRNGAAAASSSAAAST